MTDYLDRPLKTGAVLPDFSLQDGDEQPVTLADVRGPAGTVILFIRGTWCSFCVGQIRRLNGIAPNLAEMGIGVACISHDSPAVISAYEQSTSPPLRFSLLVDSDPSLSQRFGVYDENHDYPIPSLFYADADDVIRFVDSNRHDRPLKMSQLMAMLGETLPSGQES